MFSKPIMLLSFILFNIYFSCNIENEKTKNVESIKGTLNNENIKTKMDEFLMNNYALIDSIKTSNSIDFNENDKYNDTSYKFRIIQASCEEHTTFYIEYLIHYGECGLEIIDRKKINNFYENDIKEVQFLNDTIIRVKFYVNYSNDSTTNLYKDVNVKEYFKKL